MIEAVVKEVEKITPSVVIVKLSFNGTPFSFKAGQFIQILLEKEGKTIRKPYSISSNPKTKDSVEFCLKIVPGGFASNYLASLNPEHKLSVEGPFGHFTLQEEINNDVIFVATGTGISAIKPMVEEALKKSSHDVWLFFGIRTEQDIIYKKEFENLVENKKFHFIPVLSKSDNPEYEHGHVQDAFKKLIKQNNQDIYMCGLALMVDEVRQLCKELGFPDEKIHYEKYV
ncbi:hypothetical protein CMO88_01285 [Candidatus Woesearchaeota archaeon]|nr:hypothetical protein [Candidatus Woesearchaeota archaeon]|tara:strand:+ start:9945 stop:10628 length:684 start_codon:yes stop_codon:yes gene_type:complete